jgi:hypothetical protein
LWELWAILRKDDSNHLFGTTRLDYRNSIFDRLGEAKLIATIGTSKEDNVNAELKVNKKSDLSSENYVWVEGEQIATSHYGRSCNAIQNADGAAPTAPSSPDSHYELWEYLKDMCTKISPEAPPRSSIYYPDQNAGPDLVFALEPKGHARMTDKQRLL